MTLLLMLLRRHRTSAPRDTYPGKVPQRWNCPVADPPRASEEATLLSPGRGQGVWIDKPMLSGDFHLAMVALFPLSLRLGEHHYPSMSDIPPVALLP